MVAKADNMHADCGCSVCLFRQRIAARLADEPALSGVLHELLLDALADVRIVERHIAGLEDGDADSLDRIDDDAEIAAGSIMRLVSTLRS
jgi:hypothetical protein